MIGHTVNDFYLTALLLQLLLNEFQYLLFY